MKSILLIFLVLLNLSLYASTEIEQQDLKKIKEKVIIVHNLIKSGVGNNTCVFNDEIIEFGEGHCGHFSKMLVRELLLIGYNSEIISLITYNKRNHAVVQVTLNNGKKILLDSLSNVIYNNSIEEILLNPLVSQNKYFDDSRIKGYSNLSFFKNIKRVEFIPYVGTFLIKNIEKIIVDENIFYKKPNDINSMLDYSYNSYAATKTNSSEKVKIQIEFKKQKRLSSIVLYPYDDETFPAFTKIFCDEKIIFEGKSQLKRSMIPFNFYGNDRCEKLNFEFSDFKGQNRLLLRDIYIYGK